MTKRNKIIYFLALAVVSWYFRPVDRKFISLNQLGVGINKPA